MIFVGAGLALPRSFKRNKTKKHHRKYLRLKVYDYSQIGAYFVTVCARNHELVFGKIVEDEMRLNDAGRIVQNCWNALLFRFPGIELDAFMIMPNHVHGIIMIVGAGQALSPNSPTLGDIIRVFKSTSAINLNLMLSMSGQSIWQRNYYEHIIRDEESLSKIREYIAYNPLSWSMDRENPDAKAKDPFDNWIESFRALRDQVQKEKAEQLRREEMRK